MRLRSRRRPIADHRLLPRRFDRPRPWAVGLMAGEASGSTDGAPAGGEAAGVEGAEVEAGAATGGYWVSVGRLAGGTPSSKAGPEMANWSCGFFGLPSSPQMPS